MYLDNKLIFLAGATGSVGSAIMKYILDNYHTTRIRATYRQTEPFIKHERVEYVRGDLRLQEDCRKMIKGCDCAIMAASNSAGSQLMTSQPWRFISDNIIMNVQMFDAFYHENIKRAIFIGTATAYQEFDGFIKENELDMNIDPHHAYLGVAWISRFIEKMCKFWHEKTGMEILIVRASNIFGPYASFDTSRSYFIPAIIRKSVEKMDPFEVWGSPDVTRDVLYSEDFARAIAMIMNNINIKFDVFNIGSGIKTTVNDVVNWSLKYAVHNPSEIKYNIDKPTTIKSRTLDISKAENILGWKPEYTVENGIEKTVEWWKENRTKWKK